MFPTRLPQAENIMDVDCCCQGRSCTVRRHRTSYKMQKTRRSKFFIVPRKFDPTLWLMVFMLQACAFFCNAQQQLGAGRDPVRKAHDFDTDFDDLLSNYPNLGDYDDFRQKNMHLFAVTGHQFNRSLVAELKAYDPNVISEGDIVKVNFPRYDLPDSEWLVYKEETSLLQGVPLSSHEGANNFYVTVVHVNSPSRTALTLPCTVEVLPEEKALEMRHNSDDVKQKVDTPFICQLHDPVTIATINLNAESKDTSHLERLRCVQNLGRFFELPTKDVTFHPSSESMQRDGPIESGLGNAPKLRNHRGDRDTSTTIALSWPLGCNSDIIGDIPSLDKLETTALDGSLARAIGYDVTGWQILNRVHHFKRIQRTKRRSGNIPSSASIFYPPAIKLPIRGSENVKIMEDVGTEVTVAHLQSGRTRVAVNMIRATPVPEIPVMASRVVTPGSRGYVIPPSTPSVMPPQPGAMQEPNEAPMLLFGMNNINARMGTYIEFRISNDVFYDKEDGMASFLQLELLDLKTHENISNDNTWIMFDSEEQLIYGVPDDTAIAKRELILIARDSGGKSASITFFVFVDMEDVKKPTSHKFTFVFSEAPHLASDNEFYRSFGKMLTVALAMEESLPGRLTMLKTGLMKGKQQRYISWFDRLFDESDICESRGIKDEANLMIGEDASMGRNSPAKEFAAKFRPDYKLKYIKIELLGSCNKHTTTTASTVLTTQPITTPVSTTPNPPTTAGSTATSSTSVDNLPPIAVTPPLTTTTTTTQFVGTTTSKAPAAPIPPQIVKPLPSIVAFPGKVTKFVLPSGIFSHPVIAENELKIQFSGDVPVWIALDSDARSLYFMPTTEDFASLDTHNATYKLWKGNMVAKTVQGVESEPIMIKVFAPQTKMEAEDSANHKFNIVINNYDVSSFTAFDRMRLLNLIGDIFGDKDAGNIHFYPIRKGSVVFSWYNSSLSHVNPCPYKQISMLSMKVFKGKEVGSQIKARFRENNFTVSSVSLTRTKWCKTPKGVKTEQPTTGVVDVAIAGKQGKSTTIIIIAVVVVCLVILIVILVVKCRMAQGDKAKREEMLGKQEREDAAAASGTPDISDASRIKKGVPIILQGELAMELNGSAHTSVATPLMTPRRNGDARGPAVTENDENIHEETRFITPPAHHPMTPPTPIMSDRPPPPYVKSR